VDFELVLRRPIETARIIGQLSRAWAAAAKDSLHRVLVARFACRGRST